MATTIWKGHIAFGLVSSPGRPQAAARSVSVSFNQIHQYDYSRFKLLPGREQAGHFARGTIRASTAAHTCTEHETASAYGRNFGASSKHHRDPGFGRHIAKGRYREVNDSGDGGVPAPRRLADGAIGTKHNRKGHAAGIENRRILFSRPRHDLRRPNRSSNSVRPRIHRGRLNRPPPRQHRCDLAFACARGSHRHRQTEPESRCFDCRVLSRVPPNANRAQLQSRGYHRGKARCIRRDSRARAIYRSGDAGGAGNASRILRRSKQFTSSCCRCRRVRPA